MAEPILDTNATFAHGTFPSFKLYSDGKFTGRILPEGHAFLVNQQSSTTIDKHQMFLASRGRSVRSTCSGFIMAASTTPFEIMQCQNAVCIHL